MAPMGRLLFSFNFGYSKAINELNPTCVCEAPGCGRASSWREWKSVSRDAVLQLYIAKSGDFGHF